METSKKIKIVTHDGLFHVDDVFAVATLIILLGEDNYEVIRSRDPKIVETGDYVVDVGYIYDPEKKRFDHHQKEGAGTRQNGVPYASFGLVWKKFGEELCKNRSVSNRIDKILVQQIDAGDTGFNFNAVTPKGRRGFSIEDVIRHYRPSWNDDLSDFDPRSGRSRKGSRGCLRRICASANSGIL